MKQKLALNFKGFTDNEVENLASIVAHSMTGNKYFPDAGPIVNEVKALHDQFMKAMADAGHRDIYKVAVKNEIRFKLLKKMKKLGEYAENEANGVELALLSSGFSLVVPGNEVLLSKPVGFKVGPGPRNGEIIMQVRRVMGAKSYRYEYTPDPLTPDSHWQTICSTRCKMVLQGLPLGVKFWFRMAAIGSRNQVVYTGELCRFVA